MRVKSKVSNFKNTRHEKLGLQMKEKMKPLSVIRDFYNMILERKNH